ncbi:MAG: hypothetical protein DSO02_00255 [Hadesarchaea archaeon]|nr:MAG: hypothetical protein DSO02_00255 [Hadesarchaea archaeon]
MNSKQRRCYSFNNIFSNPVVDLLTVLIYAFGYSLVLLFAAGYMLWKGNVDRFAQYLAVLTVVHSLALLTWAVYPVAPPRIAYEEVRSPRLTLLPFTETFNPFPYGAFPSLHVADTLTVLLFLRFYKGRKWRFGWALFFILVVFSTLYLGEHYLADAVAGCMYSLAGYLFVSKFISPRLQFVHLKKDTTLPSHL